MSFSRVQGAHNSSSAAATSIAATGSAIGAGNVVIGIVQWGSTTNNLTSVTDNKGNTYTIKDTLLNQNNQSSASFILGNISGGPTVITANFSASDSNLVIIWDEFSGALAASDPSDVHHAQAQATPGTGTNAISSAAATTTQNGDLIYGGSFDTSGSNTTFTAGTGFSAGTSDAGLSRTGQSEFETQSTSGSVAATFTGNQAGGSYQTFMVAVKAAVAAKTPYVQLNPAVLQSWYTAPEPPRIGGRQPADGFRGSPGAVASRPPRGTAAIALASLMVAWIPPPPDPFFGEHQPLTPARLDPPQSGPPPQNPPFPGARVPQAVLNSWLPPDPAFQTARNLLPPLIPAPPAVQPPPGASIPEAVLVAWLPPDPAPPTVRNLSPPISGPTPTPPPVNGGAQVPLAVEITWIPPPPQPPVAINLDPPISGPPPQAPPVAGGASVPLAVLDSWLPSDPASQRSPAPPWGAVANYPPPAGPVVQRREVMSWWELPPYQVFPLPFFTPSGSPVQNPPFAGGAQVPLAVLVDWIPPPPQPPAAINLDPPISGPAPQNPPFMGGAAVPGPVLQAWLPPPPQPSQSPLAIPPAPPVSAFVSVGAVIPAAVLLNYDWAPVWPWARAPIVTPSGPTPTPPPLRGRMVGVDIQNAWLPPQPAAIVGPPVPQVTTPAQVFVPPRQPGLVEAQVWWNRPPPGSQAARNLTPPSGPAAQNPPFAGGARVDRPVLVWWIPPDPQAPTAWRATQTFAPPPPVVITGFDPRFVSTPEVRYQVSTPQPRIVVSSPDARVFISTAPARIGISTPNPRITVSTPQGPPTMPQGNDFSDADVTETVTDTWNFAPWLGAGVTLTGVPTTTATLRSGTDASPASRLIGNPSIVTSPTTGKASQAVQQQAQALQPGACYILSATCDTSDGQTLTVWAYQRGKQPS